jgi:hypothetical protein
VFGLMTPLWTEAVEAELDQLAEEMRLSYFPAQN